MKLDNFIIQIAILFLPGVVWARLDASWARQNKPSDTEFFVRAFLFGLTSYLVLFLVYSSLGLDFELVSLEHPSLFTRPIVAEVIYATVVSLILAIGWIYASTHKWVARMLQAIGATKRFGDEDVWDFTLNSRAKAVEFMHLRDFEQQVVYAGYVNAFSEREGLRELVLRDVTVYDFNGNAMYDIPLLYLSRKPEGLHVEFPIDRRMTPMARDLDSTRFQATPHKGWSEIQGGVVRSPNVLTEGSQRKGGLNGPTQLQERPAPPPAFKPSTAPGTPAGSGSQGPVPPSRSSEKK